MYLLLKFWVPGSIISSEVTCVFSHNSSPAGIAEQILFTAENRKLLEKIRQRYKHSDVVQKKPDNSLNRLSVEGKWLWRPKVNFPPQMFWILHNKIGKSKSSVGLKRPSCWVRRTSKSQNDKHAISKNNLSGEFNFVHVRQYRIIRIIRPCCIIRPPLLRLKVMWKGIYIYSIRPPSTAGLLPVLETTTAGKWQFFTCRWLWE